MADSLTWVVLAGGRGSRLGADKALVEVGGARLIDILLAAVPAAEPVIVVGPALAVDRPVTFRREDPPLGGPAAALSAALDAIDTEWFALTAVDMPWAASWISTEGRAVVGARDDDGCYALDAQGQRQLLCAILRTDAVRARGDLLRPDAPLRDLFDALRLEAVPSGADLRDIDTPEDLRMARESGPA